MNRILKTGLIAGVLIAVLMLIGSCAPAEGQEGSSTSTITLIIFLVVIFALFYFVMIRPQRRKQKEQQEMVQALQKGDRVITAGGIFGVIDSVREDSFIIKVEGGTTMRIAKTSVMALKDQMQVRK